MKQSKSWIPIFTIALPWAALALMAAAAQAGREPNTEQVINATAQPAPGETAVIYTAPSRGTFVLTQACTQHDAMYVQNGTTGARLTFGRYKCTRYEPGLVVEAGTRLDCVNKSGESRTCMIVGVTNSTPNLGPAPHIVKPGGEKK